ncbi:MAG: HEPN domain-containing protein, partial [Methanosarcinales archaeon]
MDGTSRRKTAKTIIRLISALEHIKMSEISLNNMSYNFAVYHSQQACEMSMKACLASVDLEDIFTHRVSGIFANRVINEVSEDLRMEFQSLLSKISELEFKYIPSRYDTVDETGHLIAPFLEFDIDDAKDT